MAAIHPRRPGHGRAPRALSLPLTLVLGLSFLPSSLAIAAAIHSGAPWWCGWLAILVVPCAVLWLPPPAAFAWGAGWGAAHQVSALLVGGSPLAGSPGAAVVLVLAPAALVGSAALVRRRAGFHPVLLAAGWVALEYAYAAVDLGNGTLFATQRSMPLASLVGTVLGTVCVAFLMIAVSGSFVLLAARAMTRGTAKRGRVTSAAPAARRCARIALPPRDAFVLAPCPPRGPPAVAFARTAPGTPWPGG